MTVKFFIGAVVLAESMTAYTAMAADYELSASLLNNLTSSKVRWSTSSWQGSANREIALDGKNFYYKYSTPDGYETKEAISNLSSDINKILFNGNYTTSASGSLKGGSIYVNRSVDEIVADFVENYLKKSDTGSDVDAMGGALYSDTNATLKNIDGYFVGNYTVAGANGWGGAVYNGGKIENLSGSFIANSTYGAKQSMGGAIYNQGIIENLKANFIGNKVSSSADNYENTVQGGAIANINGTIENIQGDFIANSAINKSNAQVWGGAIANVGGTIGSISGNFYNNYAQSLIGDEDLGSSGSGLALGGAIFADSSPVFDSQGTTNYISGNYTSDTIRGKIYNGVYLNLGTESDPQITFDTSGGGAWIVNDSIDGGTVTDDKIDYNSHYNLLIKGDDTPNASAGTTTQYVSFNNNLINVAEIAVENTSLIFDAFQHDDQTAKNWNGRGTLVTALNNDGSSNSDEVITSLSLNNAVFNLANGYQDIIKLKGWKSNNGFLHIDVSPDSLAGDMLKIYGNVEGTTNLIVHATSQTDIRGKGSIVFAQSTDDEKGNANSFNLVRVYKSPYLFDINYTQTDTNANRWSLVQNDIENPYAEYDEDPVVEDGDDNNLSQGDYTPEVIASMGLQNAALEQISDLSHDVNTKIAELKNPDKNRRLVNYGWQDKKQHDIWAMGKYKSATIKSPVEVEAKINGVTGGFDVQGDMYNRLGFFGAYRQGEYELSGKADDYGSSIGSNIDINSYLAGVYYRSDYRGFWFFASVFGGFEQADIATNDNVSNFSTDGMALGGSVEIGQSFRIGYGTTLEPSLGVFYSYNDFDEASDNLGQDYTWSAGSRIEIEGGIKLEQNLHNAFGAGKVYIKPSVVQTINSGGGVTVSTLESEDTLANQTMGRIEVGARYGFASHAAFYAWANYTLGTDYDATSLGAGLDVSW